MISTSIPRKSLTLRVTITRSLAIAVAAMSVSTTGRLAIGRYFSPDSGYRLLDGKDSVSKTEFKIIDPGQKFERSARVLPSEHFRAFTKFTNRKSADMEMSFVNGLKEPGDSRVGICTSRFRNNVCVEEITREFAHFSRSLKSISRPKSGSRSISKSSNFGPPRRSSLRLFFRGSIFS